MKYVFGVCQKLSVLLILFILFWGEDMITHSVYKRGCVSCGGEITDDRLISIGVCEKCFNDDYSCFEEVVRSLDSSSKVQDLFKIKNEIDNWVELFSKAVGTTPWNTQITWMKRVILGRSFSLIAPTGVGKTTFGITTSLSIALKGKKSIIILPTANLVHQVYEKIKVFSQKVGIDANVIMYSSKLTEKQKSKFKEEITNGNYDIVIITSTMVKNLVSLKSDLKFDFIFADDVDSLLKQSKNIEYVIMLSGLSKDDVDIALEVIKLKFSLAVSKGGDKFQGYLEKYSTLSQKFVDIKKKKKGIIVVSSATAKPKGARVKLFKELFDFEVGSKSEVFRNVGNYYILSSEREEELIKVIETLGDGGIVFVSTEEGLEYAEKISNLINQKTSLKSAIISSQKGVKDLERFKKGEINILVGVSTYYGALVRGIDIPERIIYSVFVGIPRFRVIIDPDNLNVSPYQILKILLEISSSIEDDKERKKIESFLRRFRNNLNYDPLVQQGRELLRNFLREKKYIEFLKNATDIVFQRLGDKNVVLIPDLNTYIQGSGRTSRLYPGGMTRGISVVIEENQKLLGVASRKYKWIEDIDWEEFSEEKVLEDLKRAKEDRVNLKRALKGEVETSIKMLNKTVLIIVESPTKAKTISKLLGNPSERIIKGLNCYEVTTGNITFIITSSKGHIFELTTDREDIYGIRLLNNTLVPVYDAIKKCLKCNKTFVSDENKCKSCGEDKYIDRFEDIVSLIELVKEVDEVFLASDPDTEGEKISYDIFAFLNFYTKFFGGKVRRMRFNEVTYYAIKQSIDNPQEIQLNLVESQLLRRVQDRLIGFGLSQYLKEEFKEENVSAGRVQSPVLGWIVERFREYNELKSYFTDITLSTESGEEIYLSLEVKKDDLGLKEGDKVNISLVEEKDIELFPFPPFTTDTILVQANRFFKMNSDKVMAILQDLFEEGLITYHRTESTTVSLMGQQIAKEYLHIKELESLYNARGWESEGAHECIRPTKSLDTQTLSQLINEGSISSSTIKQQHLLIYDLIFKRFIASQMKTVIVKNKTYSIKLGEKEAIISRNTDIVQEGWNKIGYLQIEKELPSSMVVKKLASVKKPKVSLLSEADVIQIMKQKGIGRPSTYAKIISTLLKRGYVIHKNNRLIPTKKGIYVYDLLKERFYDFVSEDRTRYIEDVMNKVEKGEENYFSALNEIFEEYKKMML